MLSEDYVGIAVNRLPNGRSVSEAILDGRGDVLLPAGKAITGELVTIWEREGVAVYVHRSDRETWASEVMADRASRSQTEEIPVIALRIAFSRRLTTEPPARLMEFVQERVMNPVEGKAIERRTEGRFALALPVPMLALDDSWKPVGELSSVVVRDVSPTSLGIVSPRASATSKLAVEFKVQGIAPSFLLCDVVRCERSNMFYDIGCRISSRVSAKI